MNEREIFETLLEMTDPKSRQAFLDKACGGNSELRAKVESLLKSHEEAGSFLNVPAIDQLEQSANGVTANTIIGGPSPSDDDDDEGRVDLSFLKPSTKPGSIGTLGHYEILQVLGQGAFGIVFKAFDEKLHRHVAIKAMNPQLAATSPPRKRFLREARSVAALKHENVIQIYSVEEEPLPYLAMEFVDGTTLADKLTTAGPLEVPEILHLGRQMAAGLAAAHEKSLIHRDIKPGNILIEAGAEQKVKITDFGLARAADDATMTRTGTIAGTPMYMAPEQAMGHTLDHRADLFSLGSVLYQMTCGRPPFRGANALAVLKRVVDEDARAIQDILPDVPDWLCTIIAKLHAKNPEERYQSAKEVADLLGRCQSELQLNGEVDCVQSTHHSPRDERPGSTLATLNRPFSGKKTVEPAANQPQSAPANSSQRSETATFKRPLQIAAILVPIIGLAIFYLSPSRDTPDSASEISNFKSQDSVATGWQGWPADAPKPAIAPFTSEQAKQHQEEWAAYLKVPVEYTNSIGMKFRLIPPGEFLMGSTESEVEAAIKGVGQDKGWHDCIKTELPRHVVILTQPIFLGVYEVTQGQYEIVMGSNPSQFSPSGTGKEAVAGMISTEHPVECVTWNDAAEFSIKLNNLEKLKPSYLRVGDSITDLGGSGYRLPSEAEWEYACRAGTETKYWTGSSDEDLVRAGYFGGNSGGRTHAVGELMPNPFGLYDLHGNVWEWMQDGWDANFYRQYQEMPAINPNCPFSLLPERVLRGSCWLDFASGSRSSGRLSQPAIARMNRIGFRVCLNLDAVKSSLKSFEVSAIASDRPADAPKPAITPFTAKSPTSVSRNPQAALERSVAEWAIRNGGTVVLEGNYSAATTEIGQLPKDDFHLASLSLHDMTLNDEDAARIGQLARINSLNFEKVEMSPAAAEEFSHCPRLRALSFTNAHGTSELFKAFTRIRKLRSLILQGTNVSDASLTSIASMPCLSMLTMTFGSDDNLITDHGLEMFVENPPPKLAYLSLGAPKIGIQGVHAIAKLKHLSQLYLGGSEIDDEALMELATVSSLSFVDVRYTSVTSKGTTALFAANPGIIIDVDHKDKVPEQILTGEMESSLRHLEERGFTFNYTTLALPETRRPWSAEWKGELQPEDAQELANLITIRDLLLVWSKEKASLPSLQSIAPLKNLVWLDPGKIGDNDMSGLVNFPKLQKVGGYFNDESLQAFSKLPHIAEIEVRGDVHDSALEPLMAIPTLNELRISWDCPNVTREFLQKFADTRPDVDVYNFNGGWNLIESTTPISSWTGIGR